jgi:hypothetical protein
MENHHSTPADAVSNRKRYTLSLCLLWLLGSALAASNFFIHSSQNPLGYDEGDYYEAVQRGWWLNWSDADNIPLAEYVSLARRAVQGSMTKAELSNYIREKQSTMFLRHEHSSVAFYPALALRPFVQHLPLHEQLRLANLAWILLWFTFLCVIFLRYPDTFSPWIILLPASASFAMSSAGYNMHIPFGLVVSAFLYCWFLYSLQPQKRGLKILTLFLLAATLIRWSMECLLPHFFFCGES